LLYVIAMALARSNLPAMVEIASPLAVARARNDGEQE